MCGVCVCPGVYVLPVFLREGEQDGAKMVAYDRDPADRGAVLMSSGLRQRGALGRDKCVCGASEWH